LSNGALKCWGRNDAGQLGYGDISSRGGSAITIGDNLPPVDLGSGRSATAVSAALFNSCAILDDKTVKCWGNNTYGQLGLGDTTSRSSPTVAIDLGTGRTAQSVKLAGYYGACALLDTNQIKCWGYNANGECGVGDTNNRGDNPGEMGDALPSVSLGTGLTVADFGKGGILTCAVLDTEQVKCWGENTNGCLGTGDTFWRGDNNTTGAMGDSLLPIALGTGRTVLSAVGGMNFACAILDDTQVKCWGDNTYGELGYGDTINRGSTAASLGDSLPVVQVW
jgi:alpha-tubulin suppressor-like RCC1 family protein